MYHAKDCHISSKGVHNVYFVTDTVYFPKERDRISIYKECKIIFLLEDTPLHLALHKGYTDLVNILLDRGANVNAANHKGKYK